LWIALIGGILALCGHSVSVVVVFMLVLVVLMVWVRHRRNEHRARWRITAGMKRGIPVPESARRWPTRQGPDRSPRLAAGSRPGGGMPLDLAITKSRLWLSTGMQVARWDARWEARRGAAAELEAGRSLETLFSAADPVPLSLANVGSDC
jgi:hypothetical protein